MLTMQNCLLLIMVYISGYIWRALFQNAINAKKKKMSLSCHFAVYWTYSLLHQCFMSNRYISLFKMYLTLLTSQRGALATDAKSSSLWRSLLERAPPAPETLLKWIYSVLEKSSSYIYLERVYIYIYIIVWECILSNAVESMHFNVKQCLI